MTASAIAFVIALTAFAIYGLYVSAASLRDRTNAHVSIGGAAGLFPGAGLVVAGFGVVGLFFLPWFAHLLGFPGAALALVGVSMPMLAAPLVTRVWTVARLSGAQGVGELMARHYGIGVAAATSLLVNLAAIGVLAALLYGSTLLVALATNSVLSMPVTLWLSAAFVAFTAAPAGIRTGARLAPLHAFLVAVGVSTVLGTVAAMLHGLDGILHALASVDGARAWPTTDGRGGGDYSAAVAVAGAGQSLGLMWTHLALGGAIVMLAWLPWTVAMPDPRRLGTIHTRGVAALSGALLIALAFVSGLTTISLGGIEPAFLLYRQHYPWSVSIVALGGVAALHATVISLVAAAVDSARPLWTARRSRSVASHIVPNLQVHALVVVAAGLGIAHLDPEFVGRRLVDGLFLPVLGLLPVVAACWFPRATAPALLVAMVVGGVAGFVAPAWVAFGAALVVVVLVSLARPRDSRRAARIDVSRAADEILARPADERGRATVAWLAVLLWVFFAIGPGMVIGNDIFGSPSDRTGWRFELPSIAVWQILAWVSGAAIVWFLARGTGLATLTRAQMDRISAGRIRDWPRTDRPTSDR